MNSSLKEGPAGFVIDFETFYLQEIQPYDHGSSAAPSGKSEDAWLEPQNPRLKVMQLPTLGDFAFRVWIVIESGSQLTMQTVRMCENENFKQVEVAILMTHPCEMKF